MMTSASEEKSMLLSVSHSLSFFFPPSSSVKAKLTFRQSEAKRAILICLGFHHNDTLRMLVLLSAIFLSVGSRNDAIYKRENSLCTANNPHFLLVLSAPSSYPRWRLEPEHIPVADQHYRDEDKTDKKEEE